MMGTDENRDDDFSLNALIVEELRSSPVADPTIITEHVAKRVPDDQLRVVLSILLRPAVVLAIRRQARSVMDPEWDTKTGGRGGQRWADAGAMYQALLSQRVEVGESQNESEWKFLGDCTRGDLMNAVDARKKQAMSVMKAAKRFEALADLLSTHEAATVSELPLDKVAAVFA